MDIGAVPASLRSKPTGMDPASAVSDGVLIGNAFPLSLVRRRVVVEPQTREALRGALAGKKIFSFWGHASTQAAASSLAGVDLAPLATRPAVACDAATHLPSLHGALFRECWVIAPEYSPGFRPALGAEVSSELIAGWQILRLAWGESP